MNKKKPFQILLLFFLAAALSFCGSPQKKKVITEIIRKIVTGHHTKNNHTPAPGAGLILI